METKQIELVKYKSFVVGHVRSNSRQLKHLCILWNDNTGLCDCESNIFRGNFCKHLCELKEVVKMSSGMFVEFIKTELREFNELVGGLPVGTAFGIVGEPESGKTILSTQLAFEAMRSNGKNAMIVDTEGNLFAYKHWIERFSTRYNIPTELIYVKFFVTENKNNIEPKFVKSQNETEGKRKIYVVDIRDLKKLLVLHGKSSTMSISEGGKFKISPDYRMWKLDIKETLLFTVCVSLNIGCLVYDSITMPIQELGSERENFPVRATVLRWLLIPIEQIASELSIPVICVNHQTKDPTLPEYPSIVGGKAIHHAIKIAMHIRTLKDNKRAIRLIRHPYKPPWEEEYTITLTSDGFK